MIDGVHACFAEVGKMCVASVWDERLNVRGIHADVTHCRGDLAGEQYLGNRLSTRRIINIRRGFVFGYVLVVGGRPGDLVQVQAVFGLEDSPRPKARRDRVSAIDTDGPAFQVLRFSNSGVDIVEDGPVMEISGEEYRDGGDGLAVSLSTKISSKGHLTNIEIEAANHAPHGRNDGINLKVFEIQISDANASILQRLGEPIIADGDCQGMHASGSAEIGC